MTREEEIKHQASEFAFSISSIRPELNRDSFIEGAKWADKTMIDKVCKWLDDNFMDLIWGRTRSVYAGGNFEDVDEMIENFRKAMEE